MLLLPFLPITALIIQNSTTLNELLQYQTEVQRIGDKVEDDQAVCYIVLCCLLCRWRLQHTWSAS